MTLKSVNIRVTIDVLEIIKTGQILYIKIFEQILLVDKNTVDKAKNELFKFKSLMLYSKKIIHLIFLNTCLWSKKYI